MSAARRLATGLVVVALAGGCTSALVRPADSASELQELRQRLVEMQRQAAVHQLAIEELRAQVASLEVALGVRRGGTTGGAAAVRPTAPPVASQRPAEVSPSAVDRPMRDDDLEIDDLEAPEVSVVRPSEPIPEPSVPASAPGVPPTSSSPSPIPPAGQALYDRGYTLYHQGRYVDAEASFQRFLQAHGESDLGDNAQYWIGEARYARGDYRGALAAFQETAERYPGGNKVPDALLKAGQSLEQLGDREGARAAYRTVVDRFGTSAAAVAAEERLARLP